MSDLILIRGHRVLAYCGVLPEEQDRRQPLEFDIDIETDLVASGATDQLEDTISYSDVVTAVDVAITSGRFVLLERVAQVIADIVLEHHQAGAVTVEVRKLRPPVPQDVLTSAVRIRRSQ